MATDGHLTSVGDTDKSTARCGGAHSNGEANRGQRTRDSMHDLTSICRDLRTLDETLALDGVLLWFRPLIAAAVAMVVGTDEMLIAITVAMAMGAAGSAPSRRSVAMVPTADCNSSSDGGRH